MQAWAKYKPKMYRLPRKLNIYFTSMLTYSLQQMLGLFTLGNKTGKKSIISISKYFQFYFLPNSSRLAKMSVNRKTLLMIELQQTLQGQPANF